MEPVHLHPDGTVYRLDDDVIHLSNGTTMTKADKLMFCQARTGAVRTQRIDVNLSRNRIVIRLSVRGQHWMVVAAW